MVRVRRNNGKRPGLRVGAPPPAVPRPAPLDNPPLQLPAHGVTPPPFHSIIFPGFANFHGMLPSRYLPDNWLNLKYAGVPFQLQADTYPLIVAAGATGTVLASIKESFDHYVIAAQGFAWATAGQLAGIASTRYAIDVRQWALGDEEQFDSDPIPFSSVFGSGEYPHRFNIPQMWSANTTWNIDLENRTSVDLAVFIEYWCLRKGVGSFDREQYDAGAQRQ